MPLPFQLTSTERRTFGLSPVPGIDYAPILQRACEDGILAEPTTLFWQPAGCAADSEVVLSPLIVTLLGGHDSDALSLARRLIEQGVPPCLAGRSNLTALHVACGSDHLEIVEKLLRGGADPSAVVTTPSGLEFTPLQLAALNADQLGVGLLLSSGASASGWFSETPGGRAVEALTISLDGASFERAVAEFSVLHYREPEQRYSWMEMASMVDFKRAVACLLENGWEVSCRELAHAAMWSHDIAILELLVAAGAPVWTTDAHGPLTMACLADSREKATWLLKHGANPNEGLNSEDGLTPLDLVEVGLCKTASAEKQDLVQLICAAGGVSGRRRNREPSER